MSSSIGWIDTIKTDADGINGKDFGEVQNVSNGLIPEGHCQTRKGLVPRY